MDTRVEGQGPPCTGSVVADSRAFGIVRVNELGETKRIVAAHRPSICDQPCADR